VESQLDQGTIFRITFNQADEVHRQVFHDSDIAKLYYDANLRTCVVQWKKNVSDAEYRNTLSIAGDSLKHHKNPGLISDITKLGAVAEEDKRWLISNLTAEGVANRLRQIAIVGMNKTALSINEARGLNIQMFDSMEDAVEWMEKTL
jgi:hypothetical protein